METIFGWMTTPEAWLAFATLLLLEIVLGIDNIIFISILSGKLPSGQQDKARTVGLLAAGLTRLMLLASINWVMSFTKPIFTLMQKDISGKDLILFVGGIFLLHKAIKEMKELWYESSKHEEDKRKDALGVTFIAIIVQIMLLDIVFSLDSVITAVGMARDIGVMVCAVVITVVIMLSAAKPISEFVQKNPTIKVLALTFLMLVGIVLVLDGLHIHISKAYIYFAMGFSLAVELFNMKLRRMQEKSQSIK